MVFSTTTLFKSIPCPKGDDCNLTSCIYLHKASQDASKPSAAVASVPQTVSSAASEPPQPASKRRKVTYQSLDQKPPSRADLIRHQLATDRATKAAPGTEVKGNAAASTTSAAPRSPVSRIEEPISPPTRKFTSVNSPAGSETVTGQRVKNTSPVANDAGKSKQTESLNPRLVAHDPVGHAKRTTHVKYLHEELMKLNNRVKDLLATDPMRAALLSDQEIISLALDEEEKIATTQKSVYSNVVKQRIVALRKMRLEDWVKQVLDLKRGPEEAPQNEETRIDTGLTLEEEVLMLPQLTISDQQPLAAFGYVCYPPTAEQAAQAARAVEISQHYEACDRCASKFRVFPERNEEGHITSHGPCYYHPYRRVFPPKSKTDRQTGPKEPYHPCCNELMGTQGCTKGDEHVFKTDSADRLAAVLPFIITPENPSPAKDRHGRRVEAVAFDCEMGYTAKGMEMIRLTVVTWPYNEELLDVLVRPLGAVIDLNSRFSGVFAEHYRHAIPYDQWKPSASTQNPDVQVLPLVDSPQTARDLLCSFITPKTPLIGHSIDNDLNVVRLCHPTIIDTCILYPHHKGLPMCLGLKMLTYKYLKREIQTGGERGHDSKEDAIAAGDLVRLRVGERWRLLRAQGWSIKDHQLLTANGSPSKAVGEGTEIKVEEKTGGKRKASLISHNDSDGEAGEEAKGEEAKGDDGGLEVDVTGADT